jgi:oligopeptide transport system substrate-binding protein
MPVGNGPFKMAEPWASGQYIKVVAFEEYSGTRPKIEGIDFKIYSDVSAAFMDFKAGTLDWVMIPTGQYASTVAEYGASDDGITANPGKQVQNAQEYGIAEIIFNNQDELFKNADLRRAVSLAINREAICDAVWEGVRNPASSIIPVGFPGYEENAWQYSRFDREAAKAMLAKAGYPNGEGLPTVRLCFVADVGLENYMQLVQADLKEIGITAEFETSDGPTYYGKLMSGAYQIGASGWSADYPTIDSFIRPLFSSAGSQNFDGYKSPAVDQAMAAASQIIDDGERMKAAQAVVKMIGDDCPEIAVASYAHNRVASDRVHNLVYSRMNQLDFVSCWISD